MLAVIKAARNELLVALHLSLDLGRDCRGLAMLLCDRDTATDHHRDGSAGNHYVRSLEGTRRPYTAAGALSGVECSALAFDGLIADYSGHRDERLQPLLDWIARVRDSAAGGAAGI